MCVTLHLLTTLNPSNFHAALSLSLSVIKTRTFSCGHCQRQGVVAAACGRALILRKFTKTVVIADSDAFCVFLRCEGECHLTCLWHCSPISEAYLLRKLKNLCRGAAASLSYKYPAQRICCGSNRVLGLLGGRLLWREQFGAEPCMKPLYCLELPVLPERRGQPLFTRSHTYTVRALVYSIVCVCMCVIFNVCAPVLWPRRCGFFFFSSHWAPSCVTASNWHGSHSLHFLSFRFIMTNLSKPGWTLDLFTVSDLFSLDISWVVLLHHLLHNVSAIYHSWKVVHGHPPSPGNSRLYLQGRERSLSRQGQPRGILIVQYPAVSVKITQTISENRDHIKLKFNVGQSVRNV